MRRVGGDNAARHQPVEQHADRSEMLLDRRFCKMLLQPLDIGRHMQRLDIDKLADLVPVAPGKELEHCAVIGHAGICVPDGGREEFQKAPRGLVARVSDDRRHDEAHGGRSDHRGWLYRY